MSIEKVVYLPIFLIPYMFLIKEKVEFDLNKILIVSLSCLVFWIVYYGYGINELSILCGLGVGVLTYVFPYHTSLPIIGVLGFNPIDYRFAGIVLIASLLLYTLPKTLKIRIDLKPLYYQASFFLLIGTFLSIENAVYLPIFLISYIFLIKEKVEFDFDEALVVAFSCLGFWIILIEFNYLEYIGLFLAITTALLIYFLNNIIEE
ncbi:MAG TPA: hypothetical protein ENI51_08280 [Candidatus Atribacteria bacterium]|nr:hypothetical protein [Candidatus Atribacteria bacterium]